MQMHRLAILSVLLTLWAHSSLAIVQLLGSCLDDPWIKSMQASLKVDSQERDDKGGLKHPFLQPAARHFRRTLEDPRTANPKAYSPDCMPADAVLHGVGVKIDQAYGAVLDKGRVNGSVVVDIRPSVSGELAMGVFSILAAEVYDYPVSLLYVGEILSITERMSSVGAGICTPTHANLELWSGLDAWLNIYANESAKVGLLGYIGVAGIYTTTDFINDSNDLTMHQCLLAPSSGEITQW